MIKQLTMDLTEKLISLVQENPCLYDCRIKNYKNVAKKDLVWEQIAHELEQNSETIKNKWKNLKDGYAKYKKSFTGNCTAKVSKYGNWVWGPYLSFLDGAAMMRSVKLDAPDNTTDINPELLSSYKAEDSADVDNTSNIANDSSIQEFLQLSTSRLSRKRRASNIDEDYQIEDRYSNVEKDSIDLLFESYAKTLKQMKPRTQAAIKIKLAQIFADAELEELQQSENQNAVAVQCNPSAVYSVLNSINDNETYPTESVYGEEVKKE